MRNPDLEDYFHFFPNFPILYSFAEPSAYAHSFIHSLTDPFILPTFIEHLSWSATISAAVWDHSNCFAPLFYSFSIFPGQTLAISQALRLGVSIHSTPHPFHHSCCWWPPPSSSPASSPPIPLPSNSGFIPSSSLPQPQLGVSSRHILPQVIDLRAFDDYASLSTTFLNIQVQCIDL